LSVFDKETETWTTKDAITMTHYQFNVFKAVANNTQEKEFASDQIVFSKSDIDDATDKFERGELTEDLSEYLNPAYKPTDVMRYDRFDGFSTYVTNGNDSTSGQLLFKYGSKWGATFLSDFVKDRKQSENDEPVIVQSSQPAKETKEPKEGKEVTQVNKPETKSEEVTTQETINNNQKSSETPLIDSMPEFYRAQLKATAKQMGITPSELEKNVKKIAKEINHSEYFILHLISSEKYLNKGTKLKDGTVTAGFGRTRYRDKTITEGMKVTSKMAFDWLKEDILYFENIIKGFTISSGDKKMKIGDNWDNLPLSLKEGMLDVAFNRNVYDLKTKEEYSDFREYLLNGKDSYPDAAVSLRQEFNYTTEQKKKHKFTTGLMKRNCYRFLLSIRSFKPKEIAAAKESFKTYYDETIVLLEHKNQSSEVKYLKEAWEQTK